jgi:hypothetical protein
LRQAATPDAPQSEAAEGTRPDGAGRGLATAEKLDKKKAIASFNLCVEQAGDMLDASRKLAGGYELDALTVQLASIRTWALRLQERPKMRQVSNWFSGRSNSSS